MPGEIVEFNRNAVRLNEWRAKRLSWCLTETSRRLREKNPAITPVEHHQALARVRCALETDGRLATTLYTALAHGIPNPTGGHHDVA